MDLVPNKPDNLVIYKGDITKCDKEQFDYSKILEAFENQDEITFSIDSDFLSRVDMEILSSFLIELIAYAETKKFICSREMYVKYQTHVFRFVRKEKRLNE